MARTVWECAKIISDYRTNVSIDDEPTFTSHFRNETLPRPLTNAFVRPLRNIYCYNGGVIFVMRLFDEESPCPSVGNNLAVLLRCPGFQIVKWQRRLAREGYYASTEEAFIDVDPGVKRQKVRDRCAEYLGKLPLSPVLASRPTARVTPISFLICIIMNHLLLPPTTRRLSVMVYSDNLSFRLKVEKCFVLTG